MSLDYCELCGARVPTSELVPVLVAKQTHSSPAEYEMWCRSCAGEGDDRDMAYERAAARYDGIGRDWR